MEMRKNGHDTKILDMDPDVPYVDPNAPVDEEPEDAMSPKTKRGVKAIFDVFDTRKEGMLSTVTLGAAFHKLGVAYKPELVKLAMDEFDLDGNGMLDFGEFMELLASRADTLTSPGEALLAVKPLLGAAPQQRGPWLDPGSRRCGP